jgi:hypothetical protein
VFLDIEIDSWKVVHFPFPGHPCIPKPHKMDSCKRRSPG